MAEYKVAPHLPSSQTTQAPGGSIIIMPPTKAVVGFLATLAIAEAAKLNDYKYYIFFKYMIYCLYICSEPFKSDQPPEPTGTIQIRRHFTSLFIWYNIFFPKF